MKRLTLRGRRGRVLRFSEVMSERLGVDEEQLYGELQARLGGLFDVVTDDVAPDPDAIAWAYGDLWALGCFINEARLQMELRGAGR